MSNNNLTTDDFKKLQLLKDLFSNKSTKTKTILGGALSRTEAAAIIEPYRRENPNDLFSVFIDRDIINYIVDNEWGMQISGIRAYIGQHTPGKKTVILCPTTSGTIGDMDIQDTYFNYGDPCPPNCLNDEFILP